MKRFVGLSASGDRSLGWSGDSGSGVLHLAEGDHPVDAHGLEGLLSLKLGDRVYRVERLEGHHWRVNGRQLESRVLSELEHRFAGFGAGQEDEGPARLEVPMPGRIVKILVKPGDEVARGQGLVIVEAMKMENELKATRAAVVAAVRVIEGQGVEKGAVLVDFV